MLFDFEEFEEFAKQFWEMNKKSIEEALPEKPMKELSDFEATIMKYDTGLTMEQAASVWAKYTVCYRPKSKLDDSDD